MAKILITDDSEFMRSLVKKTLKENGYEDIVEASTGDEAVEKFQKENPDLVLLDIVMNEPLSGINALKKIKELNKEAKVIMITVVDQQKITDDAMAAGASGFITKPIDNAKLIEAVKKALE